MSTFFGELGVLTPAVTRAFIVSTANEKCAGVYGIVRPAASEVAWISPPHTRQLVTKNRLSILRTQHSGACECFVESTAHLRRYQRQARLDFC